MFYDFLFEYRVQWIAIVLFCVNCYILFRLCFLKFFFLLSQCFLQVTTPFFFLDCYRIHRCFQFFFFQHFTFIAHHLLIATVVSSRHWFADLSALGQMVGLKKMKCTVSFKCTGGAFFCFVKHYTQIAHCILIATVLSSSHCFANLSVEKTLLGLRRTVSFKCTKRYCLMCHRRTQAP